jgi:hypothetical protein
MRKLTFSQGDQILVSCLLTVLDMKRSREWHVNDPQVQDAIMPTGISLQSPLIKHELAERIWDDVTVTCLMRLLLEDMLGDKLSDTCHALK